MFTLMTTRFNDETWNENKKYRTKHNITCLYGSTQEMSPKIIHNSIVFMIEMNNSKNQIEGIGLIRNNSLLDKYYKIYDTGNFNRYVYMSKYHIDRETLIRYNDKLVKALDHVLFKEKTHQKRGDGHTTFPEKLLKHKICDGIDIKKEIRCIFIDNYGDKSTFSTEENPLPKLPL